MEQSYIVLIILAIMIAGFILNKWSYGLTTMICCALLALSHRSSADFRGLWRFLQ